MTKEDREFRETVIMDLATIKAALGRIDDLKKCVETHETRLDTLDTWKTWTTASLIGCLGVVMMVTKGSFGGLLALLK
jgi:hypothetical protein